MITADVVKNIGDRLRKLYFFKMVDINRILDDLERVPEDVIGQISNILSMAEKKQQELLVKVNSADRDFNSKFKRFLVKVRNDAVKRFSDQEGRFAEDILKKL
ncbi:MAG: hypothetical protein ACD_65C00341G0003 [uncultured bacterium]|nr:MAG: hypothetical protein ACD_65C00341G0003 [uncultured bacterium]KKT02416.1 MAG: hypothetical protein UV80_C0003G0002 [Candidatus Peregrinibacteria bacterium GW2011_GWF2_43_17]KKT19940.1 MAG: hypothetical protein UW03_C0012G0009 [Candidatus Peregrinibacteria bacterium GW2011_GWA2_43_8]HAU40140.1 hypothetical protein [Candidatus Peregrinibacteria bacterium]